MNEESIQQWKMYIQELPQLKAAVDLLHQINKLGYKAFIVGGAVRDIVMGSAFHDIDIATNAPIDVLEKSFKTHDIGKSKSFGIVVVNYGGQTMEVAQFRQDGKYSDGRRPDKIKISGTFEEDAARRDFTINAMGINAEGEIVDYFDGQKDVKNKVLRTVGNPRERFGEDYLRMMRLPRFAARMGFNIDKDTEKAVKKLSSNIKDLAPERIRDELIKAASLSGDKFANYIILLDKLKLLKYILPEIMNLKWFKENLKHHPETRGKGGTVYAHVIEALKKSRTSDPIKNLAILLHDIGKGVTLTHEQGLPRYLEHAKASMDLVNQIADRLKMSNQERESLIFAVGNHMKFHDILSMKASKIAKLVSDDNWDVLVAVAHADETSRGEAFMYAGEFEKIVDKAIEIKDKFGMKVVNKQLKLVDGKHVMDLTGYSPGKKIGEIIRKVTEEIMDRGITDQKEIDALILSYI